MTERPQKEPAPVPRPVVRGFPAPGRQVEHAYRELDIALYGSDEQKKALGSPRLLARPWDPPSCVDPDLRAELWDWLDRVVARGLGPVGPAALEVSAVGVLLERAGQVPLFVPRGDLVAVGTGTGIAGEVVERDGMVIVGWRLGDERLDTGFRASTTAEQRAALDALAGLVDAESANTSGGRS